ncbi:hypothetical protein O6H91_11G094800 [Diphasiastrum complanatum]|uniref:Uncharacterized protein n=1 Tax=Diphasiastrum complanatum TaxID=34168 RepID=A0ACC2CBR3_DIPCM|nr:hypothetical protein O6H91_11G094800 [Diphasiastrum complanatum]
MPAAPMSGDLIEPQSLKKLSLKSLKRSYDLFAATHADRVPGNPESRQMRITCKVHGEYAAVKDLPSSQSRDPNTFAVGGEAPNPPLLNQTPTSAFQKDSLEVVTGARDSDLQVVAVASQSQSTWAEGAGAGDTNAVVAGTGNNVDHKATISAVDRYQPSAAVMKRLPSKWPRPSWHPPWKNYRVISGHLGWVRSIAFDPGNEWFCTGSADRTIKIWDVGTGTLKLTLTGHIEQVRGLAVSPRHPYMFSAGDDKQVKCWDLEYNKVIRSYHGHLSGVYCLSLHPTLDILLTGGRDSVCRVWDMRTKAQIYALSGHENTVCSIITQATDPQVVTGSHDTTIKLWDLAAAMSTLTFHKKSVRALALHPFEHTFASASADNIKKFRLPKGEFLHNMLSQQRTIVNCMTINEDNVLVSGGDNGSLWFWDWKSGHNFQQVQTIVQPGSLDSEAGIYASAFDMTGSRLITCEADKTIKMWKEDDKATPETHPIHFKPPKDIRRF